MRWLGATLVCLMVFAGAHGALGQEPAAKVLSAEEKAADAAAAKAPAPAPPPKSTSMDELLKRVKAGWNGERKENRDRETIFAKTKADQQRLLNEAKATRAALERRSQNLETEFEGNEIALANLEETLTQRLGALGELFGVVRQVSGDTRSQVEGSLVSAQIPGREEFLEELGKNKSLPSIESLEKLWFILHQEMTELGKVIRFPATVVTVDGEQSQRDVIRVGAFNALSGGVYLIYEDRKLQELPKQPAGTYLDSVSTFENATGSMATLALDPSRGSILKVLIQTPDFMDRIKFGKEVGYTIIALGGAAFILAIIRWVIVFLTGRRVAAQKKSDQVSDKNPLGRILGIYEENRTTDVETLELKLDEAILRESASLDKLLWAVKVVSVVAPLMGLLGTVTGMIKTFQAITLFGTGDPKMMASGISEALVTTMLGLYVAIPLVLLHALVSNTSKGVVEVLEEQAAGLIARRANNTMLEFEPIAAVRAFIERGGDVLLLIAAVTFLMWTLMLERFWYFKVLQPREVRRVEEVWRARSDHESWFADQVRRLLVSEVRLELHHSVGAIKTLVALCPMLGLLGTVTGMIEVFDVMAIAGSGNTRAMASGVSKATIPTMAGMVAALSGMILSVQIERFANHETERVADRLTHAHE